LLEQWLVYGGLPSNPPRKMISGFGLASSRKHWFAFKPAKKDD
jgi:hypothetical protein